MGSPTGDRPGPNRDGSTAWLRGDASAVEGRRPRRAGAIAIDLGVVAAFHLGSMFKPWRLWREFLDIEFDAAHGSLRVRVIERPGRWLGPDQLASIIEDLRRVVRSTGVGELNYGVLTGQKDRLDRAIITLIYDRHTHAPVAFNALVSLDCVLRGQPHEVIHLGLTSVDPRYRERGVAWVLYGFTTFLLFMKRGLKPYWISNVTQVPAVVGMVCEATANCFPSPDPTARRTFDHLLLAKQIMSGYRWVFGVGEDAEFDLERFVIMNSYTGGSDKLKKSFEATAKHRDGRYNELCRRTLDYQRGDDFLQLGQVNLLTLYRYLLRSLPRDSMLTAVTRLLFVGANSLVVPVLQWLTPEQPMGDLRPWEPRRAR